MNAFSIIRSGSLIAVVAILASAENAAAQASPYLDFNHPSVSVDLSVIEDSGYGAAANGRVPGSPLAQPYRQGRLLIPGARPPSSMLHVKPVGGPTAAVRKPAAVAKKKTRAPAKKKLSIAKITPTPTLAPAPAPAPMAPAAPPKPVIGKTKPAPKPVKVAAAPKKLKAPEAPQAPSAPPPPTVAKTPQVTAAETAGKAPMEAAPSSTQKTEQASVPPAGAGIEHGLAMQVIFANDATRLPSDAKNKLKALADKVKSQDNIRLQLMAYAGGDKLSASLARRLSLSRALSVRSYLIESGVRSTRIDVRALGNKTSTEPRNRVDLNITER